VQNMKKLFTVRWSLLVPLGALLFWWSDASAQSQDEKDANFAKYALKLREDVLQRVSAQPSLTKTTFTGNGTGYSSGTANRSGTRYPGLAPFPVVSGFRVLMVGDSMTVGGFGEAMQDYLLRRFGSANVAVYASCGSSPEHWIRSGPNFVTKCGYREQTPRSSILRDFQNGKQPEPAVTPKLEDLVEAFHPTTVIVQLGTNWMDGMAPQSATGQSTYSQILDRFVAAVHSAPNTVRRIIWITPPDASLYSREVKASVTNLIKAAAQRDVFATIDSNSMTHYIPGKSGGDGVHYNSEEAKQWANRVVQELDGMLH
jgi:GDSL-like lipase/acylhydrolase family protein